MPILISEQDQADDHCRLTFMGQNWYILCIDDNLFTLKNEEGVIIMDASRLRWSEYCETASHWLAEAA